MALDEETRVFSDQENASSRGELPCGALAGDYVVERLIARGGCGAVYAASHRRSGARVAVKVLHESLAASPKMVARFFREVDVLRLLRHPAIVEIYECGGLADGRPFFVMEHLDGVTVDVLLREEGRLSPSQALELLEPACAALEAAHAAGIIHRDVKASNIFVTRGPTRSVKLLDFGIAKLLAPEQGMSGFTTGGRAPGTLTIMAPEQILGGPIDARVDVYALGVLLHRLLTGRFPFYSANTAELLRLHLEEPPPRPSSRAPLPPALDAVVLRCLEKQPEHRFSSVKSFLYELREAVGEPGVGRDSSPELTADAIAIYLDVRACLGAGEADDSLVDELGAVLDLGEQALRKAGLTLVSTTGSEVLAMRLLLGGGREVRVAREKVVDTAVALYDELTERSRRDGRVRANLCMNVGQVVVRSLLNPEIIGGDLARVGAWAPAEDVPGLCAMPEVIDGLSGLELMEGPGRLVIISGRFGVGAPPATLRSLSV